jgi:UDP-N-acetylglucosamine--N-acetylmuramyl-(pentapeptide) pyrophosphoryl-undecaprenol N-acetylglucosamine transferase
MLKNVCMVTGGTGGHIYPALALADEMRKAYGQIEISFIGNDDRMEKDLIPAAGYPFFGLHTSGLVGSFVDKAKAALQMAAAYKKAKAYLKKQKPQIVIGFGGYVSAPVMLAAQSLHIPTLIHEQNSIVGKANKMAMKKADAIVCCYENVIAQLGENKTLLLGNPRATTAFKAKLDEDYYASLGLSDDKKTILIMMGSLGSSSVNELMRSALKGIDEGLQFLYVCGKANDSNLDLFDGQENIHVVPYVDTLKIYEKIDGMICRAGATTLAEVCALGIPSILIPSPYVANNHQFYNASQLVEKNAALMIEEKDLNAQSLQGAVKTLFMDEEKRESVSKAAKAMGKPDAANKIMELAESLCQKEAA